MAADARRAEVARARGGGEVARVTVVALAGDAEISRAAGTGPRLPAVDLDSCDCPAATIRLDRETRRLVVAGT